MCTWRWRLHQKHVETAHFAFSLQAHELFIYKPRNVATGYSIGDAIGVKLIATKLV
jgi:hypothetical protein